MKSIIRNFIAKRVAGRSDDGIMITLSDPRKVDFQAAMLEDLLMRNGIDPRAITNETQLKNILNQIKAAEAQAATTPSGIRNIEQGKVFDMEGKEIPQGSRIMGGKQIDDDFDLEKGLDDLDNLRVTKDAARAKELIDAERIKEEKLKAKFEKQNKDSVQRFKDKMDDPEKKADGGRIGLMGGKFVKLVQLLKNKKKVQQAVDDIFPTGDYKMDAEMAAESLVENNPKTFSGMLYEDLDDATRSEVYGAVLQPIMSNMAKMRDLKRATKPQKTLQSMKEGKGINMSDPEIAEEFTRFMKETDPEGYKKLEQTVELSNFDPKGRKKNATGGRAGLKGGSDIPFVTIDDKIDEMISFYKDYLKKGGKMDFKTFSKKYIPQNFATGGRAGFFMGSRPATQKGLATLRQMLNYFGEKSDRVKNPSDILRIVNPKQFNKMLEDPNIYRKFDIEKGLAAPDLIKNMQKQMMMDRKKTIEEMLGAAKNIRKLDDDTLKYKNNIIEDMMKKGVDRKMAEEMAETISDLAKGAAGKFDDTPKLTDEGVLQLENILKDMETGGKKPRELNATGGRIGYKDGPGMNRRTFLKLLGGLASIPIIGKIVKPLKTVKGVKNVPIIKTDNVPGKPEWFDQLVNKVIIEGDDVTKKLATKDREVVHVKKLNDTDEVTVYQDLETDSIRVEYNSPQNMLEEPVDLIYKKTPPDEGAPKGSAEFEASEMGFVSRQDGPDDYFIDAEPTGGSTIKDLDSDVSVLKEYATGKKPTMKEFVQKKKRKDKVKKLNEGDLEAQSEYIIDRQGDAYDYDNYASGGIARMLGE